MLAWVWYILLTYSLLLIHRILIWVAFCFLIFWCAIFLYRHSLPFLHLNGIGSIDKIPSLLMLFSVSIAKSRSFIYFVCFGDGERSFECSDYMFLLSLARFLIFSFCFFSLSLPKCQRMPLLSSLTLFFPGSYGFQRLMPLNHPLPL